MQTFLIIVAAVLLGLAAIAGVVYFYTRRSRTGAVNARQIDPTIDRNTQTQRIQVLQRREKGFAGAAVALVFLALLIGLLALTALGDESEDSDDTTTTTTAPAVTTPAEADRDFCPNGTSDDLRFELDELEHPQSLTPRWPSEYGDQTERLFGDNGWACHKVQVLVMLATWIDAESILGESDGTEPTDSAEWIALLRQNGDRRLQVLESTFQNWQKLTLVETYENEVFDGDIFRLVPPNPDNLVWDQYDIPEEGLVVGDYSIHRGEDEGAGHLFMSLSHGWPLDEDIPLESLAELEDNPQPVETTFVEDASTTVPVETSEPDNNQDEDKDAGDAGDAGDTTGPGDEEEGTTGEPGSGGECEGKPSCDGENEGEGGSGGDECDKECDGDGGGDECDDKCTSTTTSSTSTSSTTSSTSSTSTSTSTTSSTSTSTSSTLPMTTTTKPTTTTTMPKTTTTMATTTTSKPKETTTTKHGGGEPTTTAPGGCDNPPCDDPNTGQEASASTVIAGVPVPNEQVPATVFALFAVLIGAMLTLITRKSHEAVSFKRKE